MWRWGFKTLPCGAYLMHIDGFKVSTYHDACQSVRLLFPRLFLGSLIPRYLYPEVVVEKAINGRYSCSRSATKLGSGLDVSQDFRSHLTFLSTHAQLPNDRCVQVIPSNLVVPFPLHAYNHCCYTSCIYIHNRYMPGFTRT